MEGFAIPVIYKQNKTEKGTRVLLPLEELLYLRVIKRHLHFFSIHKKEYSLQASFSDWLILLDGFNFEEVDRGIIANFNRVTLIFSDLQQIHFGPEAEGVFCPMAVGHIARIRQKYPHIPIQRSGAL